MNSAIFFCVCHIDAVTTFSLGLIHTERPPEHALGLIADGIHIRSVGFPTFKVPTPPEDFAKPGSKAGLRVSSQTASPRWKFLDIEKIGKGHEKG